jgi:putative transposase
MPRKRYSSEQTIVHLREAEVELAKGQATAEVCRKLGISEQTYYRCRKEYASLRVDQVRRLKDLERENVQLKKLVADQPLDLAILKEALLGNY